MAVAADGTVQDGMADGAARAGPAAVLRRKTAGGRPAAATAEGSAALRALRRAVARAAQADCGLGLAVTSATQREVSLTELLDMPEPLSLLAVIEGRGEALGFMALGPDLLAALLEQQTTGAVGPAAAPARKPTRTDAAMVAGMVDRSLAELEAGLTGTADLAWTGGYRYASFLDDPRPLGLLLEDTVHGVFRLTVAIGRTDRRSEVLLALPADARRRRAALAGPGSQREAPRGGSQPAVEWQTRMERTVLASPVTLEAVLCRMRLPLAAILRWKRDGLLMLPAAALDGVSLEGPGGRRLARARLGQSRGHRALRLLPADGATAPAMTAPGKGAGALPGPAPADLAAPPLPDPAPPEPLSDLPAPGGLAPLADLPDLPKSEPFDIDSFMFDESGSSG